jgi:hypothetical protein
VQCFENWGRKVCKFVAFAILCADVYEGKARLCDAERKTGIRVRHKCKVNKVHRFTVHVRAGIRKNHFDFGFACRDKRAKCWTRYAVNASDLENACGKKRTCRACGYECLVLVRRDKFFDSHHHGCAFATNCLGWLFIERDVLGCVDVFDPVAKSRFLDFRFCVNLVTHKDAGNV